jgi:glutamate synthase (NADPH/NADH) small chain
MFRYHTNPVKIITDENRVVGLMCIQMELKEADATGRARPVPIEGSESVIPADTVIIATGQEVDYDGIEVARRENKWIITSEWLATARTGLPEAAQC